MIQQMFCVYDSKADAYLPPFFLHSDGMALRVFSDCANDLTHQFGKHPEDYTLFHLGKFDDQTAKIELNETPKSLAVAIELVKPKNASGSQIDIED